MEKADLPGYLLDTNHVTAACERNAAVMKKLGALSAEQVRACVITLGEVAAGHAVTQTTNQVKRDAFEARLEAMFAYNALKITTSTRSDYATVMLALRNKFPKASMRTKTERWLVVECGVDINDVWIAAVALEHRLTLVSRDAGVRALESILPSLKVECWL